MASWVGRLDVIVLDVGPPTIDGFETCRRLRADGVRTRGPAAGRGRRPVGSFIVPLIGRIETESAAGLRHRALSCSASP